MDGLGTACISLKGGYRRFGLDQRGDRDRQGWDAL